MLLFPFLGIFLLFSLFFLLHATFLLLCTSSIYQTDNDFDAV
jgi:hypothetical protein